MFIYDIERDILKNFYYLLNEEKKQAFFSLLTDDEEKTLENLPKEELYQEVLNIYWLSLEEAIHKFLHYDLRVYLSVEEDEMWNAIPLKLGVWIYNKWLFSWILIQKRQDWYYSMFYVWENVSLDGADEVEVAEKLKQYIGEINYNKALILISDMLIYDEEIWTYVSTTKEFDEQFTDRRQVFIDEGDKKVYINSTLYENDLELLDDL